VCNESLTQRLGIWLSKAPDHNILVMDVEGLMKKDLNETKVNQHLISSCV
jgi:hypothetical protein